MRGAGSIARGAAVALRGSVVSEAGPRASEGGVRKLIAITKATARKNETTITPENGSRASGSRASAFQARRGIPSEDASHGRYGAISEKRGLISSAPATATAGAEGAVGLTRKSAGAENFASSPRLKAVRSASDSSGTSKRPKAS